MCIRDRGTTVPGALVDGASISQAHNNLFSSGTKQPEFESVVSTANNGANNQSATSGTMA